MDPGSEDEQEDNQEDEGNDLKLGSTPRESDIQAANQQSKSPRPIAERPLEPALPSIMWLELEVWLAYKIT